MTDSNGLIMVSVDSHEIGNMSIETTHRRRDLVELLQRYQIASNWTISENEQVDLPPLAEITVGTPKSISRGELVQHLRSMNAVLLRESAALSSVVLDPHEARLHWDVLTRSGCTVTRPRTAVMNSDTGPRMLRGGLWVAPMSCSFVGGSRRSVKALFGACQKRLVSACAAGQPFHLNVDIGNQRDSWQDELTALKALFERVVEQRKQSNLQSVRLSELPNILTKKPTKAMVSILKAA